jgi:hypothetical protein
MNLDLSDMPLRDILAQLKIYPQIEVASQRLDWLI